MLLEPKGTIQVKLKWTKTNRGGLLNYPDTYFYAFTRSSQLLYIGKSYQSDVYNRVFQSLKEKGLINKPGISIWLAHVTEDSPRLRRKSAILVSDVEGLLIGANQPKINSMNKKTYSGACKLRVQSLNPPPGIARYSYCVHSTILTRGVPLPQST